MLAIETEHGGLRAGQLHYAGHAVAMEYLTMINSTHCERVFALSDRLQKALCQGTQEFLIPKTLNPYLRVHQNGPDLDEALAVGGMLNEVTKALLRKERRDSKIQGGLMTRQHNPTRRIQEQATTPQTTSRP